MVESLAITNFYCFNETTKISFVAGRERNKATDGLYNGIQRWKHNKKLMNAGDLKPDRVEMFKQLLELGEKYKHVNQYQ